MKTKLYYTILIILLSKYVSYAQTTKDPYIPVLGENKVWYTAVRWEFGEVVSTVYYTNGTEIIDGKVYTRITNEEGDIIHTSLREDETERKVFTNWGGGDVLLYDFSLEVGDSFYMEVNAHIWYDVIAIENIETNVGIRKAWFLSGSDGDFLPVWIEGIGSMAGVLTPDQQPNLNWWWFPELLCYENESVLEYKSINGVNLGCELESIGVTELNNKLQISVFPNPTTGALSINSQINNLKTDIIITNLLGEKCYKNKISINKSTSIDISFLPKGIYLLSIVNKQQERILTKKIIKL